MSPLLALALLPLALAGDTTSTVRSGVTYLHRTTSEPQDIYAVRVDISLENVAIRASQPDYDVEQHVTTSEFAENVGALVAINGDWSDTATPVGLAIGQGWLWNDHYDGWGFFACDILKNCEATALSGAWWFDPDAYPYRYFNAVGANSVVLMADGVQLPSGSCYDTVQNPRSAICIEADRTHLWFVVVDGRSSSASGMTCAETAALLADLGCWDGVMLDGGGSSTLYVDGDVKNNPSDGSERTVSNHIGIVYNAGVDSACTVSNGKWCDGTVISGCAGGESIGSGDCAYYGATCQEDGDYAFCVDYRCPDGDGFGAACTGATTAAWCSDGAYSEGDCGAFGLVCGEDSSGASCMESRCEAGPNTAFCTDAGLYAVCTDGVYAEGDCGYYGLVCWEETGSATCMDGRCELGPNAGFCTDAGLLASCGAGVYTEAACAEGTTCQEASGSASCVDPSGGTETGGGAGGAGGEGGSGGGAGGDGGGGGSEAPGALVEKPGAGGCGCVSVPGSGERLSLALVGIGLGLALRRRSVRSVR